MGEQHSTAEPAGSAGRWEDKAEHGIRPGYEHDWRIVAGSSERTLGITGVV